MSGGICETCRRKTYCTKVCKNRKLQKQNIFHNAVMNTTGIGYMMNAMNADKYMDVFQPQSVKYNDDTEPFKRN